MFILNSHNLAGGMDGKSIVLFLIYWRRERVREEPVLWRPARSALWSAAARVWA